MQLARPLFAPDPRSFGRSRLRVLHAAPAARRAVSDFELFATTFVAGFLFVSVLIPAYNEERVIEASVRRILASKGPRVEVIV